MNRQPKTKDALRSGTMCLIQLPICGTKIAPDLCLVCLAITSTPSTDKNSKDCFGAEFINDNAARQEAVLRAMNGTAHQLEHYKGASAITVRNEQGERIYTVRISGRGK